MTPENQWMLVSDLDNTLLGYEPATQRFAAFTHAHRERLTVVYNSSRSVRSIMGSIDETDLPAPHFIIGSMGTEVCVGPTNTRFADARSKLAAWTRQINDRWDADAVRRIVGGRNGVEVQAQEFQTDYKCSFYYEWASPEDLAAVKAGLTDAGYDADVVYSSNRDLDVLPAGVNKGSATRFLADAWAFVDERVIVSGDSGNDRAMFDTGFPGIVVGNAKPELRMVQGDHIYHAKADFADGVIEGLEHWMRQAAAATA